MYRTQRRPRVEEAVSGYLHSCLSEQDWTHRDMLRSTAAMIQTRWPGRYTGDLALRLEELADQIDNTDPPHGPMVRR